MKVPDQRQRSARRNLRFPVRIWTDDLQGRGFTRDVSSSGLLIETTKVLDLGTWMQVELELARTDHVYYVSTCVVVRKEARHPQVRHVFTPKMGIRFLSPGEAMYDLGHDETAQLLGVDLRAQEAHLMRPENRCFGRRWRQSGPEADFGLRSLERRS